MPATLPRKRRRATLDRVRDSYTREQTLPRKRIEIKPADAVEFPQRFALHLRKLMERRGLNSKDVADLLAKAGVDIGPRGIDVWLRADGGPKFRDLERIGLALGFKDYRDVLPPPVGPRSRTL